MKSKEEMDDNFKKEWESISMRGLIRQDVKDRMWKNIRRATVAKRRYYRYVAAAAAVLIMSIVGYTYLATDNNSIPVEALTTKTFPHDIRLLHLPDGSRVWLNENSEIKYDKEFSGSKRAVELSGEAFFEVARDTLKPFTITSGSIRTTVLGTSFTVKAYAGTQPEVDVRSGRVNVEGKNNSVILEKGYGATVSAGNNTLIKRQIAVLEPRWKQALLDADNLNLGQVIEKLQELNDFKVKYKTDELRTLTLKGTLDTRQNFPQILETVAFAAGVYITPAGKGVYLIHK